MKILHTSDWHLGANVEGISREAEQMAIIDEISKIADEKNVDIVLIAGDVFVNPNMPDYADHMFEKALFKLSAGGNRAVVAVSGNNDIPERFVASKEFALTKNCFLFNNLNTDFDEEFVPTDKAIKLTDYGRGYIELSKGEEKTVVAFMPYPTFLADEKNKTSDEGMAQKLKRLFERSAIGFKDDSFNIVLAHLFIQNKVCTKDFYFDLTEEIFPEGYNYAALGNYHGLECINEEKNIYYSGTISNLYYLPKKSYNYVIVFETEGKQVKNKQFVKLSTPKTMVKVTAENYEDAVKKLSNTNADYIKLLIKVLKKDEFKKLKNQFKNLVNISILPAKLKKPNKNLQTKLNDEKVFVEFFKSEYNKIPSEKLVNLYNKLLKGDK